MAYLSLRGHPRRGHTVGKRNTNCAVRNVAGPARAETLEPRCLLSRPYGIDISSHQGTSINWTNVKNAGTEFVFMKATEGFTFDDTAFITNITNATAAGLKVGAYHYARPDNNSAADEVSHFLSIAGPYIKSGYMQPVLDFENPVQAGDVVDTKAELSAWANEWMNGVYNATGIKPLLYTYVSYASSYLDSTVTQWPLWMAHYSGANEQTGAPTTSPWAAGTWKFWQYTSSGSVGGISPVDRNVFNGDSAGLATWVIPGVPASPSPAQNGSVATATPTLNWADAANATSYDVYVDNVFKVNVAVSQWTVNSALSNGTHTWKIVSKNNAGGVTGSTWSFTVAAGAPATPSSPVPADGAIITVKPTKLDWADSSGATSYDVYVGTNPTPVQTTISELAVSPADGVRTWRVVANNISGSTSGPTWSYTLDTKAPTSSYGGQTPAGGASVFDFTVTYSDVTTGVSTSTLDNNDITVTGPNGYLASAALVSVDVASDGTPRVATYRIPAPGGTWTLADDGTYTISLNASQVRDAAGNWMAAQTIQNLGVAVPFAYKTGTQLHIDFDGTVSAIELANAGAGMLGATRNGQTLNFLAVDEIDVAGTPGADHLIFSGAIAQPLSFAGSGGADTFEVDSGTYTFAGDAHELCPGGSVGVIVDSGAAVIFNATQRLRALTVSDGATATLSSNGSRFLHAASVSIAPTGTLDLADNDLILDSMSYSDVRALVAAGFGHSSGGITSSTSSGNQILALFDNALVGYTNWQGEPIGGSAIVGKYTFFGDVNFDGQVTGDDYTVVDSHLNTTPYAGVAWSSGDANIDGSVTGDDYTTIDSNLGMGSSGPLAPAALQTARRPADAVRDMLLSDSLTNLS